MTVPGRQKSKETSVAIRIMATSDVHATLLDYDYAKDRATALGSLARAATVIEAARKDCAATLLFDNGDFLQGAAIADPDNSDTTAKTVNPVILAMNALKFDAVGLGNHEFNIPAMDLKDALQAAEFPVLCANLHLSQQANAEAYDNLWQPNHLLPLQVQDGDGASHNLTVGVFSVLPPQVVEWDKLRIAGRLTAEDMLDAARQQVVELLQSGADLIVALAHSGIADLRQGSASENVAAEIAALQGVDVLIAGHVHRVFPGDGFAQTEEMNPQTGTLHDVPTVMTGVYAAHLGQIDLDLLMQNGRWRVAGHHVQIIDLGAKDSEAPPEEAAVVRAAVAEAHEATLARMRRPIGEVVEPVTSYFSMVKADCASRLVAEAKLAHVEKALRGKGLDGLPLIASVAPLKCGGRAGPYHFVDVPPGPVSSRVIADMQPYSNHISVVQAKGRDIVEWLEKGCAVYNQLQPGGKDQFLYDRDAPTYNREAIYGLSYVVDLSQPARYGMDGRLINPNARRVINICWRGIQIAPGQDFLLITNDHRGGGGGNFPVIAADRAIEIPPVKVRDVLARHIANTSGRPLTRLDTWQLRALPQTQVVFDTGPGAASYLDVAELPLERLGATSGGFERYALDLGGV